jgi:tetratricopeptide (TPR) repeat protein
MPRTPDGPVRDFYERLHALHRSAGQPSMRELQRRTRGEARPRGINPTTVHDAFTGPRLARWDVVEAIVGVLGGDAEEFAVLWRDARAAQPRPAGGPAPTIPRELPPDVVAFTGRESDLAALDALLPGVGGLGVGGTVPFAVICGTAGVGKTSLAVRWAHRVGHLFPDGHLFVNLRGYAAGPPLPAVDALAAVLRALAVPPDQIPVEEQAAARLLRSVLADRRVLIILDNAASADQVRPLVPASPRSVVLVTSRDRLGGLVARDGARRLTLDVLAADEADALLARVLGADRVAAEPAAVTDLARACAYLPLALRVAAANVVGRSVPRVADYLAELAGDERLAALDIDGDPASAVRGAFEVSYEAIAADARRLFCLIGLVPGPDISAETAAALADVPHRAAVRLLDRLAAAHLVGQPASGRYASHDLLRQYAADRAVSDLTELERGAALRRLHRHYLAHADAAAKILYGHRLRLPVAGAYAVPAGASRRPGPAFTDAAALAWLDAERANLVAAIEAAAGAGPRPLAWLLADTLRGYFWLRMHTTDWANAARWALAAADADRDPLARASALLSLGDLHYQLSDYGRAIDHYAGALAASEATGWLPAQAAALGNLGVAHRDLGQPLIAVEFLRRALELCRAQGSPAAEAVTLVCLGRTHLQLGAPVEAAACCLEATRLYRDVGSRLGEATALGDLGDALHAMGRLDEAMDHLRRALPLTREIGDRVNEACVMVSLAAVHRDAGRVEEALQTASAAAALAADVGNPMVEADALITLASVHRRLGRHREAGRHDRRALELSRGTGDRYREAQALVGLAADDGPGGPGEPDGTTGALDHARAALAIAREVGFRGVEERAVTLIERAA